MDCCSNKKTSNKAKKVEGKLCYCFDFFEKDFVEAVAQNREDQLVDKIKTMMKDPGCFCETSNPSGKCCLADIKKFIANERNKI